MSAATEDLAEWLLDFLIDNGAIAHVDEPLEDVRSGGHFIEVQHRDRRLTVLVVDESSEDAS